MRILLVATVQSHICQFHKPLVKMLHAHGCEVHVAARDNLAEKNGLKLDFVEKVYNVPFERSPFNMRNLMAYRQLKAIIDAGNYDVIHTNTPVGGIVGRLAARKARKKNCQVFYTAHGFHFFKGGPKKNWLIYYPIEKFMCRFTDELITITHEDRDLAEKKFPVSVSHIHGIGANSQKYSVPTEQEFRALRQELGIGMDHKVVICTGELNANKNQITAIHAMKRVVEQIPEALLLLAGNGPTHGKLQSAIEEMGLQNHAILLGYRTDLERYVKASDIVLSCSKREGMPLNIIEGMLCGKPAVASFNRGHRELVNPGVNGFLLSPMDEQGIVEKIVCLLKEPQLASDFAQAGLKKARSYTDAEVYKQLQEIYRKRNVI